MSLIVASYNCIKIKQFMFSEIKPNFELLLLNINLKKKFYTQIGIDDRVKLVSRLCMKAWP